MQSLEETPNQLIIQNKPKNARMIGAGLFILGTLGLIYNLCFESAKTSLVCSRNLPNQVNCELSQYSIMGIRTEFKVFTPKKAYTVNGNSRKQTDNSQTFIVTSSGDLRLLNNASYEQNQAFVTEINNFINSRQNNLSIEVNQHDEIFLGILLISLLNIVGAALFSQPEICFNFDKTQKKLIIERKGWYGIKIIEHPFAQILKVEIIERKLKGRVRYYPVIVFKNLQKVPIMFIFLGEQRNIFNMIQRLNFFLDSQNT